jgi:hypothetical protein
VHPNHPADPPDPRKYSAFSAPGSRAGVVTSKEAQPDEHTNDYMGMRPDRIAVVYIGKIAPVQPDAREERHERQISRVSAAGHPTLPRAGQPGGEGWIRLSPRGVQEGQEVDPVQPPVPSAARQMRTDAAGRHIV